MMNRRDAIARVGLIMGGTVVGAEAFLSGCAPSGGSAAAATTFTPAVVAMLDEVGETILPTTAKSPGAKAAKIGEFMKVIVTDCYDKADQEVFATAVPSINALASETYGKPFMDLAGDERHALLVTLDQSARDHDDGREDGDPAHYFTLVKQLTLWGFFTSEVGSTEGLRYLPVPGKYDGCTEYEDGDRAWAAI